jgi:hypothetical protein
MEVFDLRVPMGHHLLRGASGDLLVTVPENQPQTQDGRYAVHPGFWRRCHKGACNPKPGELWCREPDSMNPRTNGRRGAAEAQLPGLCPRGACWRSLSFHGQASRR